MLDKKQIEKEGIKMRRLRIFSLLCFGVFLVMGNSDGISWAAEDTGDTETSAVSLSIPETCKLTITQSASTKTLTADGSAETAFEAGYIEMDAGYPTLHLRANKKWKMTAKSSGFAAVGGYTKPVGDLQIKDASTAGTAKQTSFGSLSDTTDLEIASSTVGTGGGGKGVAANPEQHPCQYKILLNWQDDIPGTYTATVTFTLATQAA